MVYELIVNVRTPYQPDAVGLRPKLAVPEESFVLSVLLQ